MCATSEPALGRGGSLLRAVIVGALAVLVAAALPVVADAQQQRQAPNISVMSRNIYLGSDLTQALTAPDQATLFQEAGEVWRNVQETNFTARAKLLADEIVARDVELVGLQEVALWRRDTKGAPDGPATPAEEVVYDFLFILRSELRARGANYRVASIQEQADFEIPLAFGGPPQFDGRLTMRDVILAKQSNRLRIRNPRSGNYDLALPVDLPPAGPGPEDIEVLRGWNSVEVVKIGGGPLRNAVRKRFRFVNTHLEAFSAFVRRAQAAELNGSGILIANKPVILVGDLNSDPDDPTSSTSPPDPVPTPNAATYNIFPNSGFFDRGAGVNTCCHADDLLNPPPASFSSRIDHILTKPALRQLNSALTGAQPALRTPTGLWPSDHGGVWTRLQLRG